MDVVGPSAKIERTGCVPPWDGMQLSIRPRLKHGRLRGVDLTRPRGLRASGLSKAVVERRSARRSRIAHVRAEVAICRSRVVVKAGRGPAWAGGLLVRPDAAPSVRAHPGPGKPRIDVSGGSRDRETRIDVFGRTRNGKARIDILA